VADKIIEGLADKCNQYYRFNKNIFKATFSRVFPEIFNKFNRTFKKHDMDKQIERFYKTLLPEQRLVFEIVGFKLRILWYKRNPGVQLKFFRPESQISFKRAFVHLHGISNIERKPRILFYMRQEYDRYLKMKIS